MLKQTTPTNVSTHEGKTSTNDVIQLDINILLVSNLKLLCERKAKLDFNSNICHVHRDLCGVYYYSLIRDIKCCEIKPPERYG